MDLTEEEKELFEFYNENMEEFPSLLVERSCIQSYSENDKTVQVTFGYIKRMLLEVAKKRGIEVADDITLDIDELLKEIVIIPEELSDFDARYYKNIDDLNKYIRDKIEGMNANEMNELLGYFNGIGEMNDSFREFMTHYLPKFNDMYVLFDEINNTSISDENEMTDSDELEDEGWGDFQDWDLPEDLDSDFFQNKQNSSADEEFTDDKLIDFLKFLNNYSTLIECRNNGLRVVEALREQTQKKKLEEFYSDKNFYEEFKAIMAHDTTKHVYHFHGTQDLQSATTIIREGLGMMRKDLSTTAYPELSMDEVILYSRGLMHEIGNDAIVIIDEPVGEDGRRKNIVAPLTQGQEIHFLPSGLQGLTGKPEFIVDSKYIVGYVDKRNKNVVFNSRYCDYDRLTQKSVQELGKETINEQQNTQGKDEVEEAMNDQEQEKRNSKDNTQSL